MGCLLLGAIACATPAHFDPQPSQQSVGKDFTLTVDAPRARVTIAADGRALLDGLEASDDVGTPPDTYSNDDAPPMTGFAVRDVATTYQMQLGSFRLDDAPIAPWRRAKFAHARSSSSAVDLYDDSGARIATLSPSPGKADGHLVVDVSPGVGPERRFSWAFRCDPGDEFFGFGEQTWGIRARGETIPVWVQEDGVGKDMRTDDPLPGWSVAGRRHASYMPLPEYLSRRGYVLVAETDHLSTFALCSERDDVARFELELPARVHLFWGPDPHAAIGLMTSQFGRPRVPPAFAFAPWNDAIFGQDNVRRVAKKLRDLHVPSSVIWTEDWRGGTWGFGSKDHYALKEEWDVDRSLYPDFELVAYELHRAGFKWLVYFNSFVEQGSRAWDETAAFGYLVAGGDGKPLVFADANVVPTSLVDLTNPAAVRWAVDKMIGAVTLGADGWMGDYGEWLPVEARLHGGSGLDLHNRYSQLWQSAQRQALDAASMFDGVERLSFVRSGWLGSAPLVDVFWAGDQRTDFEADDGLPTVVPMGLGASLAGISTWGSDIAGYQNATNGPADKELFFRWVELGAWSPVMRTHHGSYPLLNWNWESDDDSTQHWARYAQLHMALAPYLRGLAQSAHDTGVSILRALPIEFPSDAAAWSVSDEWMLGPGVLVAPVVTRGALGRDVHLPPAAAWYPWYGGSPLRGVTTAHAQVALTEIAVFARSGAIAPEYPQGVETLVKEPSTAPNASSAGEDRIVYAFSGAAGRFDESPELDAQTGQTTTLSYELESPASPPSGPPSASYGGQPLVACQATPVAPCMTVPSSGDRVVAYVTGPGALIVQRGGSHLATLTVRGGSLRRALVLVVRY